MDVTGLKMDSRWMEILMDTDEDKEDQDGILELDTTED
jgi:hypothetical protein